MSHGRALVYQKILDASARDPRRYTERYRPQYHFTPVEGWINDPNGLVFFNGEYHLFYQHKHPGLTDPLTWGKHTGLADQMHWGHAVSPDLIHWTHLAPAIEPDSLGAIWSGSGVVDQKDSSGFFNGKPGLVCLYTYMDPQEQGRQSGALAYSADGRQFFKYEKNPVIPQLRYWPGQADIVDFRDFKLFWHEPTQRWVTIVAGGKVRFFSSSNLVEWKFESDNEGLDTECPDLFELSVDGDPGQTRWVLNGAGRWYVVGRFDGHKFLPESAKIPMNFGPDSYASQTWSHEPQGRCLMTSWLFYWSYHNVWPTKPFEGGCLTLTHELKLKTFPEGLRLTQTPIEEMKKIRGKPRQWKSQLVKPGINLLEVVHGTALEIVAEFELGTAKEFGFNVFKGKMECTKVGYRAGEGKLFVDRRESGQMVAPDFGKVFEASLAPVANRIKMHIFIDECTVEIFGNEGREVITCLVLPAAGSDGLELFAVSGEVRLCSLEVYPLHSIWH